MKRFFLLTLIIISASAVKGFSQTNGGDKVSFGLETAIPDFADPKGVNASSIAIGGSIKYAKYITGGLYLNGSVQYLYFPYNTYGHEFARSLEYYRGIGAQNLTYSHNGDDFVTVMVGSKYYFTRQFYGEAQIGLEMTTGVFYGKQGSFAFSPGFGFDLGKGFDVGVRYQGAIENTFLYNQATLRLAYSFKIN